MRLLSKIIFAADAAAAAALLIRPNTDDYRKILLSGVPMMDVRSPVEYEKGSIPSSFNLPLMTNDERRLVGTAYKESGQDAAIDLGHSLVQGATKEERMTQWIEFVNNNADDGYLFCFRGGLRSRTVQRWIEEETGVRYPLVTGGFKAMRTFLMDELERSLASDDVASSSSSSLLPSVSSLVVICGRTGSGKTRVINELGEKRGAIDLEGLAHHRGSSFGRLPGGQPSQIDFENSVSIAFLQALNVNNEGCYDGIPRRLFVEDESNRIGNRGLPSPLVTRMKACDGIAVVDEPMKDRVEVILQDYVFDLRRQFVISHGGSIRSGTDAHRDYCLDSLGRIRKRLGGVVYERLRGTMEAAFREEERTGCDTTLHRVWITGLLVDYYDKMYDYQFAQRKDKVFFKGDRNAVIEWAMNTSPS